MITYSSKGFRRSINKLEQKLIKQCKDRIDLLLVDPYNPILNNHQLHGEYAGCRSINITGDYRAIFQIEPHVIRFIAVGTHHELFGK